MKKLIAQAIKFIGLSGVGWILDFCTYTGLGVISGNLALNNTISSWVGVTFVFVFAVRKVFRNSSKISLRWKYAIYLLYQCVLIFFMSKLLNMINSMILANISSVFVSEFSPIISKVLITPVTMVLNFLVMKGIIEKL